MRCGVVTNPTFFQRPGVQLILSQHTRAHGKTESDMVRSKTLHDAISVSNWTFQALIITFVCGTARSRSCSCRPLTHSLIHREITSQANCWFSKMRKTYQEVCKCNGVVVSMEPSYAGRMVQAATFTADGLSQKA